MDRLARVIVVALVSIALAIGAVAIWDARNLVGEPWAGFPVLPNGEVGPPIHAARRLVDHPELPRFQERVVALDGAAVEGRGVLRQKLDRIGAGAEARYTIEASDGSRSDHTLAVPRFERADLRALLLPLMAGGMLGLLLGVVPVLARPRLLVAWLFFLLNVGLAVNFGFLTLDYFVVQRFVPWGVIAGALASGCLMHLAFLMPAPIGPARTHPRALAWAIYALNGALWAALGIAMMRAPEVMRWLDYAEIALFAAIAATLLVNLVRASFWEKDQLVRRQGIVLLLGLVLVALPGGLLFPAITFGAVDVRLPVVVYLLPLWFLGVLVTYVMVAHNLFELDALVRRGVAVAMIVLAALLAQAGLFVLLTPVLKGVTAWAVAGTMVMLAVATLSVLAPLRDGAEALVEHLFFPRQRAARAAVHEASRRLVRLRGESEIVQVLRDAARDGMVASRAQLLTGEQGGAMVEVSPAAKEPLALSPSDPLRAAIVRGSTAALRQAAEGRGAPSRAVRRRLEEIGAEMVVLLPASQGMSGALVLGPRTDGRLYTRDDEILAETLAAQAAIALEHARAWSSVESLEDRLRAENLYLREEVEEANANTGEMVGQSAALRAVLAKVERVAATDAPVLVVGETGTGKELLVRALHSRSARRDRIIVKVACAALPETLLESELFGYERGAFTGAATAKPGRFEVADGGTLFLDDVDTLPLAVQAKLLRALQEGELQRLGSTRARHVDVRVVAATNRNLLDEVHAGRFREDLYYRLNVVPLELPALRDRADDIPALVERFIRIDGARLNPAVRAISAEAMEALKRHRWPGNIRELRNVVQRSLVLSTDEVLRLPGPLEPRGAAAKGVAGARGSGAADVLVDGTPLSDRVRDLKIQLIRSALARSGGNQRIAAEMLGMHRQALTRMIRDLGLQEPRDVSPTRQDS